MEANDCRLLIIQSSDFVSVDSRTLIIFIELLLRLDFNMRFSTEI